jgi:hypothetical protein
MYQTRADGSFRLSVLRGAGVVAALAHDPTAFLLDESLDKLHPAGLLVPPGRLFETNAFVRVDARPDTPVKCDLRLDPGRALTCQVVGPDGKPVPGVRVRGLRLYDNWSDRPQAGASFTLLALDRKPREVIVLHPERQLGALVKVKPGEKGPLVIRLGPTGTITGHLLGPDGQPLVEQRLAVSYALPGSEYLRPHLPPVVRSDDQGRFRVQGIIPGLRYELDLSGAPTLTIGSTAKALTLKAGEVKNLGDIKARRRGE